MINDLSCLGLFTLSNELIIFFIILFCFFEKNFLFCLFFKSMAYSKHIGKL